MALTLDPSTPTAVSVTSNGATSPSFTAPAGSVIVVLASLQTTAAGGSVGPFVVDTLGLSWLQIGPPITATASNPEAIVWAAQPTSAAARTVTVVGASDNSRAKYVQPLVFTGADLSATFPTVVAGSAAGVFWGGSTNVSDTTAYPNSVIMPSPLPIPSGAVRIPLGTSIASAATSHPAGTVFVLDAGTYSGGYVVFPLQGQQFYGQGAGVTITSNVYWRNQDSSRTNVGIFNMTVKNCLGSASAPDYSAIEANGRGANPITSGWHVANCELSNNYSGFSLGNACIIENCTVHDNAAHGIYGAGVGSIIRYNQIHRNMQPTEAGWYDWGPGDNGSAKFLSYPNATSGCQIYGNLFSYSNPSNSAYGGIGGHGLWMDGGAGLGSNPTAANPSTGNTYSGNIFYNNHSSGATDETGGNNVFTGNIFVSNGHGSGLDGFNKSGLTFQSSNHDTATGNYIWGNPTSVIIYQDTQNSDRRDPNRSKNNNVTGNWLDTAPAVLNGTWDGSSGNQTISGNTVVAGFAGVTVPKLKAGPQQAQGGSQQSLMAATLICSRTGSQMWAAYADASGGAAPTAGTGVTRYSAAAGATTGAALYQTTPGTAGTAMSITTTAPTGRVSWVAFEIVPAAGGASGGARVTGRGAITARGTKTTGGSGRISGVGAIAIPAVAGIPGMVTIDTADMPPRVTASSGDVTTAPFTAQAGTVLVAEGGLASWSGGGSVVPSVSDSSGLTWTQAALTSPAGPQDQSALWWAIVPTARTLTVTLTAVHNGSAKSLQVIPCLGVDLAGPVSSSGVGASTAGPVAMGTAPSAGAIMLAGFVDHYGVGLPTVSPGTLISDVKVVMVDAAARSATATSTGASLSIGITAPTSGVSWTYAWLVLKPSTIVPTYPISAVGAIAAQGTKQATGAGQIVASGLIGGRSLQGNAIYAVGDMDFSRVVLQVVWTGGSVTNIDVVRTDQAGNAVPVRGGTNAALVSGQWSGADYEAPLDTTLHYQVTSHGGGGSLTSQAVVLPSGGAYWLKSPGRPALNVRVFPADDHATTMTRGLPQGVFTILGRADPIVRSMRRWKPATSLKFLTATDADREALTTLLDDGQTLLYQTPGSDAAGDDAGYVAVGQYTASRVGYTLADRLFVLPVTYTGRPSGLAAPVGPGSTTGGGDSSGGGTFGGVWADVLAQYQSWADVLAAKATWADLEANIAPAAAPGAL